MTDDELMEAMAGAVKRYVENETAPLRAEIAALKTELATKPSAEAHAAIVARAALDTAAQIAKDNGDPEAAAVAIQSEVERQFDLLKPQLKGESGEPGRDGRDAEGTPGAPGRDGTDGFSPDDLEIELIGERVVVMTMRNGPRTIMREFRLAVPIYRGVMISGAAYQRGDVVTFGGSAFIAQRDTSATIGGSPPSPDWQLMVKRGRSA